MTEAGEAVPHTYLTENAKTWWRTAERELGPAKNWPEMQKRIRDTYTPPNATEHLRDDIDQVKHTGTLMTYINEFSAKKVLILDMDDREAFHGFLKGLQHWARCEILRWNPTTFYEAKVAATKVHYNDCMRKGVVLSHSRVSNPLPLE